ncbi:tetratricopeptide repeat protein [Candidatus Fermentibacteria bacterium]|nr:tetratricopeptide repeat protein [Candidatus Fermentibacteria bacterium]
MAPRKRLTKKEMKHDPVIEKTLLAWRYLSRNRNMAVTVVMAVIAVAALAWAASSYRSSRRIETETSLGRALLLLQTGERDRAVDMLMGIVADKGRDDTGKRAAYYLAHVRFEQRDFAAAREMFDRFYRSGINDPFLRASAGKGVADCDAELGNLDLAGDEYLAVAERYRDVPLAPECLHLAALALSATADKAGAMGAAERLIQNYPDYGRIGDARVLLGELQAHERLLRSES